MLAYIVRRLLLGVLLLFGISLIVFTLTHLIPANPVDLWAGPHATPRQLEQAYVELGLNKPIPVQYGIYMSKFLRGDWGISIVTGKPVLRDLGTYLPASIELILFGMLVGFAIGIPLGVMSAAKEGRPLDHASRVFAIAGVALPSFWLAMLLQLALGKTLRLFPLTGRIDLMTEIMDPVRKITGLYFVDALVTGNFVALRDALWHIVLPGITLAMYPLGLATRMVRTTMLGVLQEDYIRTARASGVRERKVLVVYALRNALGPVLTTGVLAFGYSLVSTFLIESLFAWPGLGRYAAKAIVSVDYPAITGVTLLVAAFYVVLNLAVDLVQAFMDPRIRLG